MEILKANFSEIFGIELLLTSLEIIEKHNWLNEYVTAIRALERESQVKVIDERKTLGSFFHDGFTYTVRENLNV